MRRRIGVCAAISCIGSALAGLASCEDSSSPQGPGLPEASTPDVPTPDNFVPPVDGNVVDTGTDFDAGCTPRSLAGFTVPAYVSARPQEVVCTNSGTWEGFAEACVGDASTLDKCASYPIDGGLTAECARCFEPTNLDGGIGPVVKGSVYAPNLAGCVEHAASDSDPDAGVKCATMVAAAAACVEYVCKPGCPVTDEPSRAAYLACAKAATTGVCATHVQGANACVEGLRDAGVGTGEIDNFCFPPDASPVVQFGQVARFFCLS